MKDTIKILFCAILAMLITTGCSYPDSAVEVGGVKIENVKMSTTWAQVDCVIKGDVADLKSYGVCWDNASASGLPNIDTGKLLVGKADSQGRFTIKIIGLTPSSTYYDHKYSIRAFVSFASGMVVYSEVTDASTLSAEEITVDNTNSVTVNDVVVGSFASSAVGLTASVRIDDGVEVQERGFCWAISSYGSALTPSVANETIVVDQSGNDITMSGVLNLTDEGTYFIRAYVWSEHGVKYSRNTTEYKVEKYKIMPQVASSMTVRDIAAKSAIFAASVNMSNSYGVTRRGFCWSVDSYGDPTIRDKTIDCPINLTSEFSIKVSDLESDASYRVRAFATNAIGTSYSATEEFMTLKYSTIPVLEYAPIEVSTTTSSVTVSTTVRAGDSGDAVTGRGFCWSRTSRTPTKNDNVLECGSGAGEYTGTISGLAPGEWIYVRGYAENRIGDGYSKSYIVIGSKSQ